MKVLKKIIKIAVLLFLALILGLTALDIYMIKKPELDAKKKIDGMEESARQTEDLTINTGSLGESYSILNTIRQDTVRIYCEPVYLYDSMIFVYECTPLNLLAK